ncbi:MAG: carboxypeptidase-like regulatory domain-containing protein [Phycisphaerae bacterium]
MVRLLEASGSLTGRIFDRSGRPVGNAGVNLVGTTNRLMYATRTNRTGRYSIRGVIPDMYVVDVSSHAGDAEAAVKVGKGRATQNFTVPLYWPG